MVFSSAFVLVDIAYNALSIITIFVFCLLGLRLDRGNMPLIVLLLVFNLAGLASFQPHLDFKESREFVVGTIFVAVTAVFFAAMLNENALRRLEILKSGLIAGALVSAILGLLGYLRVAGLDAYFIFYGSRVAGTFRDPNVFGPFLVLPALYLMQDIIREKRGLLLRLALLLPILLALFLSYSRGAWAAIVIGSIVLLATMAVTSPDRALRQRIGAFALLGLIAAALLLAGLLSVDGVAEVFADRFTLEKDYDSGPSGRFGSQWRSIPVLLDLPFGFGPNRFWLYYPENPHNTYLHAFASYGWVGGLVFLAFIAATLRASLQGVFARTPFQAHAIVMFSALVPHLVQNFQIDTDRWRHLFLIYGLCWGLASISKRWQAEYRGYALHAYQRQAAIARGPQPAE